MIISSIQNLISDAQIPKFEAIKWGIKKHKTCLIIPIKNEGKRIINLLKKINQINLHNKLDIIIVDGGSNDKFLQLDKLKKLNVRFLLIKNDSKGLSEQLICSYAFALKYNYHNIITIDGNNKDDPSSIPEFIKLLDKGYDFIQGSRFLNGGYSENTPLLRTIGIKFIHAPILSYFSGFKWTDTTQGFRGYSKRVLLDEKIMIFRDIFKTYELLAYLSYKIPRSGYRCVETPTKRIYPKGKVPTKINGFLGYIMIFIILVKSCLGIYDKKGYKLLS